MTGVTQVLASIERGEPHAADQLLPLVYDELRKLTAARIAREAPGQTGGGPRRYDVATADERVNS